MKNKQLLIVAAVVVVIAAIVGFSVANTGDQAKTNTDGLDRLVMVGNESCEQCTTSRGFVEAAVAKRDDMVFEFVDSKKSPVAIPAVDGAEVEGSLTLFGGQCTCIDVIYKGGHFTSLEEAAAAIEAGKAATAEGDASSETITTTFAYAGDGCANCLAVQAAFGRFAAEYDPASVNFVYYDMATQAADAAKANLTKPHMLAASDTDGCTGSRDGEIGTEDAAILKILEGFQIAPAGKTN